jgi:divalent metal cation (Fe/Co/Zn/Cd) transporter
VPAKAAGTAASRPQSQALWLSYLTVGYNLLEALASLVAGYLAGSVALTGFGPDSLVESFSGAIMIWRFRPHPGLTRDMEARKEQRAIKLVGYSFFILAGYVMFEAGRKLWFREIPEPTLPGLIIALASIVAMPTLFFFKLRTSRALNSRSFLADARQTMACFFLSLALLAGLGLNYLFGLWQADPITGLMISTVLVREGYQTLRFQELCSCCS